MTAFTLLAGTALILIIGYALIHQNTKQFIMDENPSGHYSYCLVLGAGLEKDGRPTDILMDRVSTAVELFKSAQVEQLIMSGARRVGYDEPGAMQAAAIALGIPESAVLLDPLGISTLDSCLNFKENFGGEVLIVTQAFHLPRAIFLARKLGLSAFGVTACIYRFSWYKQVHWQAREILAMPYNVLKYLLISK